jgi:hypothetical protein
VYNLEASWVFWVDVFIEQVIGIGYEVTGGDLSLLRGVIKIKVIIKYRRYTGALGLQGRWLYNIMLQWGGGAVIDLSSARVQSSPM